MSPEQHAAARALNLALRRVQQARLALRVFDGHVYVVPNDVDLWPRPRDVIEEHGEEVTAPGLDADGGAGV